MIHLLVSSILILSAHVSQGAPTVALPSSTTGEIPFLDDYSLGSHYPFSVHLPANSPSSALPPLHLFLHGKGARGSADNMHELLTWEGAGKRIDEYYKGSRGTAAVLAAENFLTVMPLAPATAYDWDVASVLAVLSKAKSTYAGSYDPSRIYITGYSMGARATWNMLLRYPDYFSVAAVAAGELVPPFPDFTPLLPIPVRHFIGLADYENTSTLAEAKAVQSAVSSTSGYSNNLNLITLKGQDHSGMADAPFNDDFFRWLLRHSGLSSGRVTAPSSAAAPSLQRNVVIQVFTAAAACMVLGVAF